SHIAACGAALPILWCDGTPLAAAGVALADQKSEGIVPGSYAHAQVGDHQLTVDIVIAQPISGKPPQSLQGVARLQCFSQCKVGGKANELRLALIQHTADSLYVIAVFKTCHHPPKHDIEWLRH